LHLYKNEEKLNTYSHAFGVILSLFGFVFLLIKNTHQSSLAIFSLCVYGFSLVLLYSASTLYHSAHKAKVKAKLRIVDHCSIYVLIAGTYTPVALITLVNGNGWLIFWTVWGIALFGIILKLFFTGKFEVLSVLLYLAMGWLIVLDFQNLVDNISPFALKMVALGGIFYTVGILFYAIDKIPYNHFIWHLFVLGGSIAHFFFILELI